MLEKDFQKTVIEYAKLRGWRVAHFRGAWSRDGKRYMTPVQADGAGFPDLVLVRGKRVVYIELKSDKGVVSKEQEEWLHALQDANQEVFVWRPNSWYILEEIIK